MNKELYGKAALDIWDRDVKDFTKWYVLQMYFRDLWEMYFSRKRK